MSEAEPMFWFEHATLRGSVLLSWAEAERELATVGPPNRDWTRILALGEERGIQLLDVDDGDVYVEISGPGFDMQPVRVAASWDGSVHFPRRVWQWRLSCSSTAVHTLQGALAIARVWVRDGEHPAH
ncbi:hypothetical protein [Microbacterium laevaniformans]|uniref:hypothetical protein n=1 Tax=Microbacterium laevaniformans TaxID=36807 RepID=UPI003D96C0A2